MKLGENEIADVMTLQELAGFLNIPVRYLRVMVAAGGLGQQLLYPGYEDCGDLRPLTPEGIATLVAEMITRGFATYEHHGLKENA